MSFPPKSYLWSGPECTTSCVWLNIVWPRAVKLFQGILLAVLASSFSLLGRAQMQQVTAKSPVLTQPTSIPSASSGKQVPFGAVELGTRWYGVKKLAISGLAQRGKSKWRWSEGTDRQDGGLRVHRQRLWWGMEKPRKARSSWMSRVSGDERVKKSRLEQDTATKKKNASSMAKGGRMLSPRFCNGPCDAWVSLFCSWRTLFKSWVEWLLLLTWCLMSLCRATDVSFLLICESQQI